MSIENESAAATVGQIFSPKIKSGFFDMPLSILCYITCKTTKKAILLYQLKAHEKIIET